MAEYCIYWKISPYRLKVEDLKIYLPECILEYVMRDSIYLTELLNFLNRPLLDNWPTDY